VSGTWRASIREDGTGILEHDPSGNSVHLLEGGKVSDGYHTFDELYRHRMLLTAALFNAWAAKGAARLNVHKSRLHSNGSGIAGYFVVMAQLPTGQISYHYPDADWDLFRIPERDRATDWDGHTSAEAADRIEQFLRGA
jgi:hypothetical protein